MNTATATAADLSLTRLDALFQERIPPILIDIRLADTLENESQFVAVANKQLPIGVRASALAPLDVIEK